MKRETKQKIVWLGGGAALGAGLMVLLDPERGRRRRALIRDKATRAAHSVGDAAGTTWRDLSHRAVGVASEARRIARGEKVADEVLVERVRARIGRLVSHPASIEVSAKGGEVTLAGPVLKRELDALLRGVRCVRGLTRLEEHLEVHEQAGSVPGLQGAGAARPPRFELLQENWSPTARFLAGLAGAGLAGLGARRRDRPGGGLALLGSGILLRAATNLPFRRLLGLASTRRGIDIHKTVTVAAPVEDVFALWSRWENFPRFFSHVREVRDYGDGRTHWKVQGPAGVVLSWDAVVTAWIPNQLLAWKSGPGEAIRHAGLVRFDEAEGGGTRLDIHLTYNPPAGALGHAVASLFGADPRHALDEDMVRLKSLLEQGKTEARGVEVTKEEVAEETRPTPRKRPAAPRGAAREPAPGGNGPTKGVILKEE
jgi:uncharacterized membrane protein/osmotically-inducible protein OsmY